MKKRQRKNSIISSRFISTSFINKCLQAAAANFGGMGAGGEDKNATPKTIDISGKHLSRLALKIVVKLGE